MVERDKLLHYSCHCNTHPDPIPPVSNVICLKAAMEKGACHSGTTHIKAGYVIQVMLCV
jgi:hypothetical protein